MGFTVTGFDEAIRKFEEAKDKIDENIDKRVHDVMKDVFAETQRRVPKETMALMRSGRIEKDDETGKESIVYGNSEVEGVGVYYAAAVHEILDAKHAPPTGPKYVELPLVEAIPDFRDAVVQATKSALKGKTL